MPMVRFLSVVVIAASIDVALLDGAVISSLAEKSAAFVRGFGYEIASFVHEMTTI